MQLLYHSISSLNSIQGNTAEVNNTRFYNGIVTTFSSDIHLDVVGSTFENNDFSQDQENRRRGYAILSLGSLTVASSCFTNNDFFGDGTVTVIEGDFSSSNNFGTADANLTCQHLAFFSNTVDAVKGTNAQCTDYELDTCNLDATQQQQSSANGRVAVTTSTSTVETAAASQSTNQGGGTTTIFTLAYVGGDDASRPRSSGAAHASAFTGHVVLTMSALSLLATIMTGWAL
mmetsp:Transcript_21961/g.61155  ORF Transcript_21961/g.61155 Transcript_21961/m.61155 type:complete len:231 (-) Transcript_21961:1189-1881(-)